MVRKCILLVMVVFMISTVSFADEIGVNLDGEALDFTESSGKPIIDENNRVLVPFRLVLEEIGAKVRWEEQSKLAIAVKNDIEVIVPIGQKYILRNNQKVLNDTSARIINGRTYLPIRIVLESFGYELGWDGEKQKVLIESKSEDVISTPEIEDEEIIVENVEVVNKVGNSNENIYNGGIIAKEFDTFYYVNFSDEEKLYSYNTKSGKSKALTDDPVRQINVVNGVIYFLEQSRYDYWNAYSMNVDGTDKKIIGSSNVGYIAAFENGLYFYNVSEEILYYFDYKKPYPEKVVEDSLHSIQIIDNYLYFVEKEEGNTTTGEDVVPVRVIRFDLDTSERTTVLEERIGDADAKIIITDKYMFYSKYADALSLYRTDLDGSNTTKVSDDRVYYFTLFEDYAYYLNPNYDRGIIKVKNDGGESKNIMSQWSAGTDYSPLFTIIDRQLFFVKKATSTKFDLYKLDLDTNRTIKIVDPIDIAK